MGREGGEEGGSEGRREMREGKSGKRRGRGKWREETAVKLQMGSGKGKVRSRSEGKDVKREARKGERNNGHPLHLSSFSFNLSSLVVTIQRFSTCISLVLCFPLHLSSFLTFLSVSFTSHPPFTILYYFSPFFIIQV